MAKGGNTENEFGTDISLMWSDGQRKDLCRRTECSGGRFTSKQKRGEQASKFQGGDITFSDPEIRPFFEVFSVESKTGYCVKTKKDDGRVSVHNWAVLDVLDSKQKNPTFIDMWKQAFHDADKTNRTPLLIFRRLQRQACLAMLNTTFLKFRNTFGDFPGHVMYLKTTHYPSITIINWLHFKDWVNGGLKNFVLELRLQTFDVPKKRLSR
jgi:hypothetical protein